MKNLFTKFLLAFCVYMPLQAQYTQNFDNITGMTGWASQNNSSPVGSTGWFQGNPVSGGGPFDSFSGAANSYIGANYNNVGTIGTISNWLFTPSTTLKNGDVVSFYTRVYNGQYPDRLEVRLSTNGTSTNVGTTATSTGDFSTLLLSVNPNLTTTGYPTTWTQYTITISGLTAPVSGRLAFRYYVTSAGLLGDNSDYIGIDSFVYTPYVCPTFVIGPASGTLTAGNTGMAYSTSLTQTGALGTPAFSVMAGTLPQGLTLSSAGILSGTPTASGTYTFTVQVTDASGCSGTKDFSIVINNCTITLPASLPNITQQCSVAWSNVTPPLLTDSCGNVVTPTTNQSIFPITTQGTTPITWTYTTVSGNTQTISQNIVIADTTAPVPDLASLPDVTAQCQLESITPPTATDNCSGEVNVTSSAVFPITTPGTTVITWTFADISGNTATQTQIVTIADTTPPLPDAASLDDVVAECSLELLTPPTATDNCSGAVTATPSVTFPIEGQGTTEITWTYADAAGNTTTQTQIVTVIDTTVPDLALQDITVALAEGGVATVTAAQFDNGSIDPCGIASWSVTPQSFTCDDLGPQTVTITATDVNGNTATGTATVTIEDPSGYCINGIADFTAASVVVYPNPTNDMLTIEAGAINHVDVYSLTGQQLYSFDGKGTQTFSMSLSSLQAGTYLVKITTDKGTATRRVVKY